VAKPQKKPSQDAGQKKRDSIRKKITGGRSSRKNPRVPCLDTSQGEKFSTGLKKKKGKGSGGKKKMVVDGKREKKNIRMFQKLKGSACKHGRNRVQGTKK